MKKSEAKHHFVNTVQNVNKYIEAEIYQRYLSNEYK